MTIFHNDRLAEMQKQINELQAEVKALNRLLRDVPPEPISCPICYCLSYKSTCEHCELAAKIEEMKNWTPNALEYADESHLVFYGQDGQRVSFPIERVSTLTSDEVAETAGKQLRDWYAYQCERSLERQMQECADMYQSRLQQKIESRYGADAFREYLERHSCEIDQELMSLEMGRISLERHGVPSDGGE